MAAASTAGEVRLQYRSLSLPLEFTFTISRGSKTVAQTVLVELHHPSGDMVGIGEAVPDKAYGEDAASVMAFYNRLKEEGALTNWQWGNIQDLEHRLAEYEGNMAAKSGLNIAAWDGLGKSLNAPLYELWGLDPSQCPQTSYTIGIDDEEQMLHKTRVALSRGYTVLKIKLGRDVEAGIASLKQIRDLAPDATIRVDANAAWSLSQALTMMPRLKVLGVEFMEEPLMVESPEADYATLKEKSCLPVMADERCHTLKDIPWCGQYTHAINLKHPKTGGLSEAMRMIHAARAHGLKIMLGCFAETSVSITALAHLSPLVDYADLDGGLLLANDPYDGVQFEGDRLVLPRRPGVGTIERVTASQPLSGGETPS